MWTRLVYFLLRIQIPRGQKRRVWAGTCLVGKSDLGEDYKRNLEDTKNTKSIWEPEEERGLGWGWGTSAEQLTKVSQGSVAQHIETPFLSWLCHLKAEPRAPRGSPPGAAARRQNFTWSFQASPAG